MIGSLLKILFLLLVCIKVGHKNGLPEMPQSERK
jgi:hypothetical protein